MNEHYVTSREWSERLKKAGVEQEAEYWWEFDGLDEYKLVSKKEKLLHQGNGSYSRQRFYAAYLTDELAGMLPTTITIKKWKDHFSCWFDGLSPITVLHFDGDTLPNTLAAMVEYCKKEKII